GGGCWRHYVPAVCDEIVRRSEFLTSVWGTASSDHGRNQAWFEYQSQLGELLNFDLVALPVYSWGCAAGHAIRMASRLTGGNRVLIPRALCPERRAIIRNLCGVVPTSHTGKSFAPQIEIGTVGYESDSGLLGLDELCDGIEGSAALYLETPSFFGNVEHRF